ncbi:MAG: hypothetical protein JO016_04355 [Actinobacteria bacterium]|nr:hypothetical protein [Actinomycetota bacterium]
MLVKMSNLDGARANGGKWDVRAGARLREDPALFARIYRMILYAARAARDALKGDLSEKRPSGSCWRPPASAGICSREECWPTATGNASSAA